MCVKTQVKFAVLEVSTLVLSTETAFSHRLGLPSLVPIRPSGQWKLIELPKESGSHRLLVLQHPFAVCLLLAANQQHKGSFIQVVLQVMHIHKAHYR